MLDAQHKGIKFTIEKATSTLNFLDVEIKINDTAYDTCIWRKPTNTGLLLNFHSICPTTWKSGLIKCFLHRAKYICSNYSLYRQEIEKLRMLFQTNAYPNWFINKIITKFENNNFNNTNDCNFSNTQEIEKEFAFTFGISYIGKPSHTFSKKLRALIKNIFNVNMNIYFRSFKVGNYFQLKCSTPTELSSNVVYKFSCPCDTAISYIGYTTRYFTRAHEHLNLNSIAKSAIKDHIYSCSHCSKTDLSVSNFEVIKKCNTGFEAKIQEALLIKKFNPTLNRQLYSSGSSYLLNVY